MRCFAAIVLLLNCLCAAPLLRAAKGGAVQGPYWVNPAHSGSWFQADRSGEGFILEILPDGNSVGAWFTFPATGEAGEQTWLVTTGGEMRGDTLVFEQVYRSSGGRFGAAFDPAQVQPVFWGRWEFQFHDCNSATLRYRGNAAYGEGTRQLQRITTLDQLSCTGGRRLAAGGGRALDGLRARHGNWFVPARSGEGWFIEDLPDGRMLIYWFTFDTAGNPLWLIGQGERTAQNTLGVDAYRVRGTHFGNDFDPAALRQERWGRMEFDFLDCNRARFRYAATDAAYGSGEYQAQRLTELAGAPCLDGTPQALTGGNWVEAASMPGPAQSELATVAYQGQIYALGGYGDPRGFKRYDIASDSWNVLPQLPSGRHHLAAFATAGQVYMVGGDNLGGGATEPAGFRYDIATQQWQPVPELRPTFGSQAALLNGRVYIGWDDGSLQEFDPRQRSGRMIAPPDRTRRDHAQVQAFLGEIWVLGGRSPDTNTVAIYDPVAESWRAGPSFVRHRGGFAAAVVGNQIMISGGEGLTGQPYLVDQTEVLAAGGARWEVGPRMPVAVHGVGGAAANGRFYLVSGSTRAGPATGATGRVFWWQPQPRAAAAQ